MRSDGSGGHGRGSPWGAGGLRGGACRAFPSGGARTPRRPHPRHAAVTLPAGLRPGGPRRACRPRLQPCPVLPAAVAVAIASAGCDAEPIARAAPADGPTVMIRDSAGVEIVENHVPERPRGQFWTLDTEPGFVLGGSGAPVGAMARADRDDRDGRIWEVVGLARLVDGRIAVLSQGNHQLFIFEASGRLSRTMGGRGQGPGEFVRPERLQYLPPDTLAVWDHWMGSVTYFDTTGAVLDHRRIDLGRVLEAVPGASPESPTSPLPDGSFVIAVRRRDPGFAHPRDGTLVRYPPVEYVRVDLETYIGRSLGIWDGEEQWAASGDVLASYPELGEVSPGLVSFDGQLASHLTGGGSPPAIYVTNGSTNEIRQFSLVGELLRIIRRTTAPLGVTERAHRAWQDFALRLGAGEYGVEAWPKREYHPAIGGLAVDAAGYLWVREWSESESGMPDQWSVFGPEGRWLGVVSWSPVLAVCHGLPCWIDHDWLVILTGDALGRARIEGYRIHRDGRER